MPNRNQERFKTLIGEKLQMKYVIHILLCCRAELQRVPNGPSIPSSRVKMCPLIKHGLHAKFFDTLSTTLYAQ